jgi:RNA polymerase sigma factor (sigma-70 family)
MSTHMTTRLGRAKPSPLGTLFNFGNLGSLSDSELLSCFRADRDSAGQEAFRILVTRHGPMVLSVCRNLIGDSHESDDAFQATFLVLVQRAASVSVRDTIGPWLYGVACRVARRARRRLNERRRREPPILFDTADPSESIAAQDGTAQILYEEIARLPASLCAPFVTCCLQGMSYDWAARQLGVSEPTLRGRLHRARRRLASRLRERGIAGCMASSPTEFIRVELPLLPPALAESTVRLSVQWTSLCGLVRGEGGIPESITQLAQGALTTTLLPACQLSAIAMLLLAGVVGTVFSAQQATVQSSRRGSATPGAGRDQPTPGRTGAQRPHPASNTKP